MIYRKYPRGDEETSLLGMGCMRLPRIGESENVDFPAAEKLLDYAYSKGINYFDTAYVYHAGDSERAVGMALKKYPRESYFIADKMPIFIIESKEMVADIFQEQLDRCGVEYFDFYLCHSLNENTIEPYIKYDVVPYLLEMKKQGKIRHLGFSNHGSPETMTRFLDQADWDFVQIQLNYLDWDHHHGKELYEILKARNIPMMIMEPVRGGRLSSLTDEANSLLTQCTPNLSISSWAMRWLQGLDGIQVILSGMSCSEQVDDNVNTFSELNPLNSQENEILEKALALFMEKFSTPCTGCRYCTETCPVGLQIPDVIDIYNEMLLSDAQVPYIKSQEQPENKQPTACIACGKCLKRCPQFIDIPDIMKDMIRRRDEFFAAAEK